MNPLDPAMPFLDQALDRAAAEAAFASLELNEKPVTIRDIRLVRHKPGRRAVIEYRVDTRDTGRTRTLIGKIRAKGLDRKSFEMTNQLSAEFEHAQPAAIRIPKPFGVVPELNMWLQEKVGGEPLANALLHSSLPVPPALIADAAYKIHRSAVRPARTHTVADELRILRERLEAIAAARQEWARRVDRLLGQCDRMALALPPVTARPIHRDFHPGQILAERNRLWLLDFDLFSLGDPAVDVGNFIAHLTELSLRHFGDEQRLAPIETAIEDTYVSLAGEGARARIRVYSLLTLARHISISTQFVERRPFTERLLSLCEQRIGRFA
jgi:hypothetical protein